MAGPRPQAAGIEAAVKLFARVTVVLRHLCRLLVFVLGAVEIPLLLVSEVLDEDEHKYQLGEEAVVEAEFVSGYARG